MKYFPIFLELEQRRVLVAGGAEQALQKVRLLLKTGADIVVVAPAPCVALRKLARRGALQLVERAFKPADADGAALVYAASTDAALARVVAHSARVRNIPVNVVDGPAASTFFTPALIDRDPVVIAIGTEGAAPVLARRLKSGIETMLPAGLGALARYAHTWRAEVRRRVGGTGGTGGARSRAFWEAFFREASGGDIGEAVRCGRLREADRAVEKLLQHSAAAAPRGRVVFLDVGVGAGADPDSCDAELLTLKAVRTLQEADVIIHDSAVGAAILEYARRDALRIETGVGTAAAEASARPRFSFPGRDAITRANIRIRRVLVRHAVAGCKVVRLQNCVPPGSVAAAKDVEALRRAGVIVEVVPGIRTADIHGGAPSLAAAEPVSPIPAIAERQPECSRSRPGPGLCA